jgi:hypothetical protein
MDIVNSNTLFAFLIFSFTNPHSIVTSLSSVWQSLLNIIKEECSIFQIITTKKEYKPFEPEKPLPPLFEWLVIVIAKIPVVSDKIPSKKC